jgi:hypothetical protein
MLGELDVPDLDGTGDWRIKALAAVLLTFGSVLQASACVKYFYSNVTNTTVNGTDSGAFFIHSSGYETYSNE